MDVNQYLAMTVDKGASDLHLSVGESPMLRIDGDLKPVSEAKLTAEDLEAASKAVMTEEQIKALHDQLEYDFSCQLESKARFRVNFFHQARGLSAAFRLIPYELPDISKAGLPDVIKNFAKFNNGLVLVTGPTGSGKSTTLAALINYINTTSKEGRHIITVEDPIEFLYKSDKCLINQREVGRDTHSFQNALRGALREDPDILLVGEMRDLETIRLALTAAETGHLVFGTMHTNSAAKTIDRIVDVFGGGEAAMIRTMLAESLRAVVAQTLMKKPGGGRTAVTEILVANPAIRNLIREQKVPQIYSAIQTGSRDGMHTMEQDLEVKKKQNLILID